MGLLVLAGCTSFYEPGIQTNDVKPGTIISNTASLSHVFVRDETTPTITCTRPQPDAAFDQGEAADISVSLVSLGGEDAGAEEEEAEEVEMADRTPAVLMTRELFYRACEFSLNFRLTKQEALDLYNKTLDAVTQVWATEAGNTTVTVGDTVTTTTGTTIQATTSGEITATETVTDTTSDTSETDTTTSE